MSTPLNLTPPHESVIGFPPVSGNPPFTLELIGISHANPNYHHYRPAECHENVIEYVISGSGFINSPSGKLAVSAGDAYLLHSGEQHDYYTNPEDPWEKIWVNFDAPLVSSILDAYGMTTTMVFPGLDISDYLNQIHDIVKSNPGNPELVFDRKDQNAPWRRLTAECIFG